MATIAEQLESIKNSKAAIKSAIQAKGVSCGEVLSDYANRIAAIPTAKAEETKTIDITSNGTFEVTPSAANKVLSKVVVNANVPELPLLGLKFAEDAKIVTGDNGIMTVDCKVQQYNEATNEWSDNVDVENGLLEIDPDGILQNLCNGVVSGAMFDISMIFTGKGNTATFVAWSDNGGNPSTKYVSGILWYIPPIITFPLVTKIYGQKF